MLRSCAPRTYGPGVEFVFGGCKRSPSSARRHPGASSNEVCASYADGSAGNKIAVSIYGVSSDVDGGSSMTVGGGSISSETLCGGAPPCTVNSPDVGTSPFGTLHTSSMPMGTTRCFNARLRLCASRRPLSFPYQEQRGPSLLPDGGLVAQAASKPRRLTAHPLRRTRTSPYRPSASRKRLRRSTRSATSTFGPAPRRHLLVLRRMRESERLRVVKFSRLNKTGER